MPVRSLGQGSFVEAWIRPEIGPGKTARLERIGGLVAWSRLELILKDLRSSIWMTSPMPVSFFSFITVPSSNLKGTAKTCNVRKIPYVIEPHAGHASLRVAKR